jgi:hypothetical protein
MANTARTTARRKAESAMAKRGGQFHSREKALHEIVADYFDASEQAEMTRATAQHNAEKIRSQTEERITAIREQADAQAKEHDSRANAAIGRILELGESPIAIADTLNIPLTRIREIQHTTTQLRETAPGTT